jgi:UDP-GlcNAc:undecaprenyl-phosphate GlcNAc-1-phosphate transferase
MVVFSIGVAFALSVMMVGLVLRISRKKSWYDRIDIRKIHTGKVPRLGGIGFACAFLSTMVIIAFVAPYTFARLKVLPVLIGMVLCLGIGVIDDFGQIKNRYKLVVQIVAALLVVSQGFGFRRFFFFDASVFPGLENQVWFWNIVTVFWIVGITNALNFIDGLDGLAGGFSLIATVAYIALFIVYPDAGNSIIPCAALAAAIAGFLVFNLPLPKAKIFMGDGGAYFLGYTLAALPLVHVNEFRTSAGLPLFYAAAFLMVPIFDTIASTWRRLRDHEPIDKPDKFHIHHKLLNLGLSQGQIDAIVFSVEILLTACTILSIQRGSRVVSLVLLGLVYLAGAGFFSTLHFLNKKAHEIRTSA